MKIGTLFLINGILAIGHGLGFIFLPSMLLAIYQVPIAPGAVLLGQLFVVQLLFIAIVVWNARDLRDGQALGAIVLGGVVTSPAVGTVVTAKALADGILWSDGLACSYHLTHCSRSDTSTSSFSPPSARPKAPAAYSRPASGILVGIRRRRRLGWGMPRSCQGALDGVELGLVVNRVQHDLAAAAGLALERPAVERRAVVRARLQQLKAKDAGPIRKSPLPRSRHDEAIVAGTFSAPSVRQINAVLLR